MLDHLIEIQPQFKSDLLEAVEKLIQDVADYDERYASVSFHSTVDSISDCFISFHRIGSWFRFIPPNIACYQRAGIEEELMSVLLAVEC